MERKQWFSITAIPLASLFLVVFYLSEALGKYSLYFLDEKSSVQRIIKFGVLVFLALALLRKNFRMLLLPALLAACFAIGQFFLENPFQPQVVVNMGKYLFPLLLFGFFTAYPQNTHNENLFFKSFEILILFNSLLMFLGFVFGIELFSTYDGNRFGYDGLFIASATGSYVYLLSFFYFLFTLKERFFQNWKAVTVLVVALLMGTKVVYAGLLAVVLIWLLFYTRISKTQRILLFSGILLALLGAFYFFFFEFGLFNEIRQERGLTDAIFSFRNDLLFDQVLPFVEQNWTWGNYLFGGLSDLNTQSQMDIVDIFFMWGIGGGLLYLFAYYRFFVVFPMTRPAWSTLLAIFGLAFLAGHFFVNASIVIYLFLLRERLKISEE